MKRKRRRVGAFTYENGEQEFIEIPPPHTPIPTAAELNEMGVSCGTCPHWSKFGGSEGTRGICYQSGALSGHGTTIDAFCSEHPKLRGEG